MLLTKPYGAQLINEETDFINRLAHAYTILQLF